MCSDVIKIAVAGVGKIVRDQHLPCIEADTGFQLCAAVSRNTALANVDNFVSVEALIESDVSVDAVALCMPPQFRFAAAQSALANGLHVFLEKPPGSTISEVEQLETLAAGNGLSLFASWHSRCAAAVEPARKWLQDAQVQKVHVRWNESVRKWHPGQEWIWQAGGMGVFDPGINGLSILTQILPEPVFVTQGQLLVPENKSAPIAASLIMSSASGFKVDCEFDWRTQGAEEWTIECITDKGELKLEEGGAALTINGESQQLPPQSEYAALYRQFAGLVANGESSVDLAPLKLVADAFLVSQSQRVEPFI